MTGAVEAAVEAAARALCDRNDGPPDWQPWTDDARAAVRAALEALAKNLTPEMRAAMRPNVSRALNALVGLGWSSSIPDHIFDDFMDSVERAFAAAIAAALKEGGG